MQRPTHVKLLEEMSIEGVGVNFDVVPFINEHLSYSYFAANKDKYSTRIDFFLDDLIERGFIQNDNGKNSGAWIFETIGDNPNIIISYSEGPLFYKIKSPALDYLYQYKTLEKAKWSNIKAWIAIIISTISTGFAGWSLVSHSYVKNKETKAQPVKLTAKGQKKQEISPIFPTKDTAARKSESH